MWKSRAVFIIVLLLANTYFDVWAGESSGDVTQILSIHESVLQAHMERDVEALLTNTANDYVLVNRGVVSHPTKQERREKFGPYFSKTIFYEYKDLIPPIVQVSEGGDLAWLIAQVKVSGSQKVSGEDQALQFVSAWIELYEKRNGTWLQTGNVSNFRE